MATQDRDRIQPTSQMPPPGAAERLFALYAWTLLALIAIPLWLAVVLLPRPAWRWAFVKGASRLLLALLGVPLTIEGATRLAHCAPCVIVANHASFTDPMILAVALPGRFVFTPMRGFERHVVSRLFMARLGSVFVGGGPGGDADRLAAVVRGGHSVMIFPEGAVYPTPGIRPFKRGAFVAAARANAAVTPVVITGSRRLLQHQSWFPRWSPITVRVLAPLHPDGTDEAAVERLCESARAAILAHSDESAVEP